MLRIRSQGAEEDFIFLGSISIVLLSINFTIAPISSKILHIKTISLICGTFSILQIPSERAAAGKIATAAFLAPLIDTLPFNFRTPDITIFSKATYTSNHTNFFIN